MFPLKYQESECSEVNSICSRGSIYTENKRRGEKTALVRTTVISEIQCLGKTIKSQMLDINLIIYDITVHNCTVLDYNLYYNYWRTSVLQTAQHALKTGHCLLPFKGLRSVRLFCFYSARMHSIWSEVTTKKCIILQINAVILNLSIKSARLNHF